MTFQPNVGDTLQIEDVEYRIAEHPAAPGIPYGQEGRAAVVYKVTSYMGSRALKVFKKRFRVPSLVSLSERLAPFANLEGLRACNRTVLTARRHPELLREHPDLTYAVLMPWIDGPTWMEVLLDKRPLSREQSLLIAQTLGEILAAMEEQGVAHCDLSGPNVMIPSLAEMLGDNGEAPVELVDVEQLFGPGLERPEMLLAGSQGYAAYHANNGDLWNARADRFAGAMLLSEMLGWSDPAVRAAAWGETYFDPEEIQNKSSDRYRILTDALRTQWGTGVADLLEYAWRSESLEDCPNFGEWLVMMPGGAPARLRSGGSMTPEVNALVERARKQEQAGDLSAAIASYQEARQSAPHGSALSEELGLIIASLQRQQQASLPSYNPQSAAAVPAATTDAPAAPAVPAAPVASPQEPAVPQPATPTPQSDLDRLFAFALAAYNRGEWSASKELLAEVVRQQPGYAANGLRAADLYADVLRRTAPPLTQQPVAAPVTPPPSTIPAQAHAAAVTPAPSYAVPIQAATAPAQAAAAPDVSQSTIPTPQSAEAQAAEQKAKAKAARAAARKRRNQRWLIAEGIIAALVLILVGALVLSQLTPASSNAGASSTPTSAVPAVVASNTAPPVAQVAATDTPIPAPTDTPSPPTPSPVPVVQAAGLVNFRDNIKKSDQASVTINPTPVIPAGKGLVGWLTNSSTGAVQRVGRLLPGDNNALTVTFNVPGDANLLGQYDGFEVTAEDLESDPKAPSADVLLSGRLPAEALTHIGHILVSDPGLPNGESVMDGLLGQLDVVRQHAGFMQQSQAQGNFANVRLHAEHLVNIIEGAKGEHYGDLNKDGKVQNPGDGVGLLVGNDQLGYLQHTRDHADKAASLPGASDNIKIHAGHVDICVENVRGWVTTIRDRSLQILAAKNLNETKPFVDEIVALSNKAINGQPVGDQDQVQPVPGSGGALTAYQHSQLMAGIPISSEGATGVQGSGGSAPAPNPTPTAAAQQNPPAGQAAGTKIDIAKSSFGQPLTVKVGTTVVWTNLDNIQHSVTADDNSFDSGTLNNGGTFSQTFTKAGTFPYYCIYHGGTGGQGMASKITVEP